MPAWQGQAEDRPELVSALFALITGKLEDAAAVAAAGQNQKALHAEIVALTAQITSSNEEVSILLRAVSAILPAE